MALLELLGSLKVDFTIQLVNKISTNMFKKKCPENYTKIASMHYAICTMLNALCNHYFASMLQLYVSSMCAFMCASMLYA